MPGTHHAATLRIEGDRMMAANVPHFRIGDTEDSLIGSVSTVEMMASIALICNTLDLSISTFETLPNIAHFPISSTLIVITPQAANPCCPYSFRYCGTPKTMGHAIDNAVVAQWIVHFLMNGARAGQG